MNEFVGIEIGGTKLQLVRGGGRGQIRERIRLEVDPARGGAGIRTQIEESLPTLLARPGVAAIGVGYGGPYDRARGMVSRSHQIEGWSDFPLHDWLCKLSGLPVLIDNDANVAALGEAVAGAGRFASPVFYVNCGSGVGGGLVVNGEIFHGTAPGECEIGHLRLDRAGAIVENACSGWAVNRRVHEVGKRKTQSALARLSLEHTGAEARAILPALGHGCEIARSLLDEIAGDLAFALSHVVHLMHPKVVVLGGGLALIGEPWRDAVSRALPLNLMEVFQPGPEVLLAGLGEDAVPVGALVLAASHP